ncbi:MAG TPA: hypothetical protein PKJ07_07040 [Bacteroidales bacterium]|nr:hypothetical protein [Bacteroidales bacterium]HPZ36932.1 hypothetical protein [Bacteroidales bacterium]HQD35232.1 hypothetical protein [Bacteroidales bacterium]
MNCDEIQKFLIEKSVEELSNADLSHINNCEKCKQLAILLDIDLHLTLDECWDQPTDYNLKILNQRLQAQPWQKVVPKRTLVNAIPWVAAIVTIIIALYIFLFSDSHSININNNDETHYYYTDVIFTNFLNNDEQ